MEILQTPSPFQVHMFMNDLLEFEFKKRRSFILHDGENFKTKIMDWISYWVIVHNFYVDQNLPLFYRLPLFWLTYVNICKINPYKINNQVLLISTLG